MVGFETTFVFCSDCSALRTRLKSEAENTALRAREVAPLFSRELRLLIVLPISPTVVPVVELVVPWVAVFARSPEVPVEEVEVIAPLLELTEPEVVEPF